MTATAPSTSTRATPDAPLVIGGREFSSRLMLGTGKYRTFDEMIGAFEASGTQIITVALRRIDFDNPESRGVLEKVDWSQYQILPNTAGCATAEEAIRVARLARSMGLSDWIKLEVIPDPVYLFPDPVGTLEAAKVLVKEGFHVLPYISDDPVLARQLEEVGCATVMPLAAPIGSGQGLVHFDRIQIIIEQANVPVVVDAGIGVPSDASLAMEIGADAVLVNSAIALARNPAEMARAMKLGVEAGRLAFLAGRMEKRQTASPSSPTTGIVR
jgi:thiazole synthase